jgi:hypothetical protein
MSLEDLANRLKRLRAGANSSVELIAPRRNYQSPGQVR